MRFLVDQNISPVVAEVLSEAGHDAVHTGDIGLATASDAQILEMAMAESRIIISADTDFGMLLARQATTEPSVVLIRLRSPRRAIALVSLLLANLDAVAVDLEAGAVVVLEDERVRVRRLPI